MRAQKHVNIGMGAHMYEGIHACWGSRCTHMRAQIHVYIYGCAHICEAHMRVYKGEYACGDSSTFIFFPSGCKSPWPGTQRLVCLASIPRVLKSLSLQSWDNQNSAYTVKSLRE